MPVRILHFADAHIDIVNYGRHDPVSGLPQRVVDFLTSLDAIVETAIREQVDLVIFAGDAYKDRNPQPTFQRAWGERIMRLSAARIPTVLLVGNHDMAPAEYRAHTMQEFSTLHAPHVFVADGPRLFTAAELGVEAQVLAIPWISRSKYMARHDTAGMTSDDIKLELEDRISVIINGLIDKADPSLPLIMTAHASIMGAQFGSERQVMLGNDLVLSKGLVEDPRLDYVALGHIHKHQVLCQKPPVVYAGSIERIDFGEAREKKGFVLASVDRGRAEWEFIPLLTRPFHTWEIDASEADHFMDSIMAKLPPEESVADAYCRLTLKYAAEHEALLDEDQLHRHFARAFEFRLVRDRSAVTRVKLPDGKRVESLSPEELLELYLQSKDVDGDEMAALQTLAGQIFSEARAGAATDEW